MSELAQQGSSTLRIQISGLSDSKVSAVWGMLFCPLKSFIAKVFITRGEVVVLEN